MTNFTYVNEYKQASTNEWYYNVEIVMALQASWNFAITTTSPGISDVCKSHRHKQGR